MEANSTGSTLPVQCASNSGETNSVGNNYLIDCSFTDEGLPDSSLTFFYSDFKLAPQRQIKTNNIYRIISNLLYHVTLHQHYFWSVWRTLRTFETGEFYEFYLTSYIATLHLAAALLSAPTRDCVRDVEWGGYGQAILQLFRWNETLHHLETGKWPHLIDQLLRKKQTNKQTKTWIANLQWIVSTFTTFILI